jgi:hypothetical protein
MSRFLDEKALLDADQADLERIYADTTEQQKILGCQSPCRSYPKKKALRETPHHRFVAA